MVSVPPERAHLIQMGTLSTAPSVVCDTWRLPIPVTLNVTKLLALLGGLGVGTTLNWGPPTTCRS